MKWTLITPTAGRPEAFALCEKYMARQTLPALEWFVLDDGEEPVVCTKGQAHFHFKPLGKISLAHKLARLVSWGVIHGEAVAIIEDDDWYAADYLATQDERLRLGYDLAGEGKALYYNVRERWWYAHPNMGHASLCQTVMKASALPALTAACASLDPFVDVALWNQPKWSKKVFDPAGRRTTIGIKAMPGKTGYGCGHKHRPREAAADPDLSRLSQFIGQEDAQAYAPFSVHSAHLPQLVPSS